METLGIIAIAGISFIAGAVFGIWGFILVIKAERP